MPDRWLRIHNLPQSQRYPETPEDAAELLRRNNAAATEVLGNEAHCALIFTRLGDDATVDWSGYPLQGEVPELMLSVPAREDDDARRFFALRVRWQPQAFDELISARADDRIGPVLFANYEAGSIYAPYDGGADLFVAREKVGALRKRFQAWLSPEGHGC